MGEYFKIYILACRTRDVCMKATRFTSSPSCLLFVSLLFAGCNGNDPTSPRLPCPSGLPERVSARPQDSRLDVLTSTGIQIQRGADVGFFASGQWDMGLGLSGPDGLGSSCSACTVHAPVGALIGRIGRGGSPFLIGSRTTILATESGTLFLGSNDNLGNCGGDPGSCYDDNRGSMQVCVEIR